jgi:uncharacterized RDD family membrane protein YckC
MIGAAVSAAPLPPAALSRPALFARRLAALAIDVALCAALLIGFVHAANAAFGAFGLRPFHPFWLATPPVVASALERGEPIVERELDGTRRESFYNRETRVHADGSVFVYGVVEMHTTVDGRTQIARSELLVGRSAGHVARLWTTAALFVLAPLLLATCCEASRAQATPGKRVLGLIVTDREGRRLTWRRALARQALKLGEVVTTFGGGYLLVLLAERPDAFHDTLAGTRVAPAPQS